MEVPSFDQKAVAEGGHCGSGYPTSYTFPLVGGRLDGPHPGSRLRREAGRRITANAVALRIKDHSRSDLVLCVYAHLKFYATSGESYTVPQLSRN